MPEIQLPETASTETESREPDVTIKVIRWDGAPKATAMISKTGKPKLERIAIVADKYGNETAVPVVGTARQFETTDGLTIDGYLGSDKSRVYFQPALGTAAADASLFV